MENLLPLKERQTLVESEILMISSSATLDQIKDVEESTLKDLKVRKYAHGDTRYEHHGEFEVLGMKEGEIVDEYFARTEYFVRTCDCK
jgi:hypothetical protein